MHEEQKTERHWSGGNAAFRRDLRLEVIRYGLVAFAVLIVGRLFLLQIVDHGLYQALASGQHEIFQELFPVRGDILMQDGKDGTLVPVATNEQLTFVYADPREITDAVAVAEPLAIVFGYDDEKTIALTKRLLQKSD